jgi:hypothetical protein
MVVSIFATITQVLFFCFRVSFINGLMIIKFYSCFFFPLRVVLDVLCVALCWYDWCIAFYAFDGACVCRSYVSFSLCLLFLCNCC